MMRREFEIEDFAKDVLLDKYALVVGNEILLDTKVEPSGDIHTYYLKKVNEIMGANYSSYHEIALGKQEPDNPVRELINAGKLGFDDANLVSPQLTSLLSTKLFTTVLTTTTDGLLEAVMKKVWPKEGELRVVNIYDKDSMDKFRNAIKSCREGQRYCQPTLIYVFGKMHKLNWSLPYVRTEPDAISLIEKWIRMDVEGDNGVLEFIKSKRILALGCKYDNWYFRFFWYILTGEKDRGHYKGSGEVAFDLDSKEKSEIRLQQFLDRMSICREDNATLLIEKIVDLFTNETTIAPFKHLICGKRLGGGVFISYSSKDALPACQLFMQLQDKYSVWLDNARLYGGDNYEEKIEDAISASKVVITILSPNVAADYPAVKKELDKENGEKDIPFYTKEWLIAKQMKDKIFIPLAINGYNLRADYHKVYEDIVEATNSGISADDKINLMETNGFNKLLISLDKHLQ